ncbi:hypothetical protein B296_00007659 [Ensete ventricosum]|uniref:Carbonic anhydrase n=1 Tax=Ensete ventricosum TaxID=4639 RepID=A0A427B515_ENSVE|nr:hypothetical protein B296_00007659 [Ensete ventricosum]
MASLFRASLDFPAFDPSSVESSSRFSGKPSGAIKVRLFWLLTFLLLSSERSFVWEKHTSTRKASKEPFRLTREFTESERRKLGNDEQDLDPFEELKSRFKSFKSQNYEENLVHYQNLAKQQSPKFLVQFMVIACADSRVCPSNILGFQPGEAFTVRNIANLVPPFQHGASETSAALEFAVNTLEASKFKLDLDFAFLFYVFLFFFCMRSNSLVVLVYIYRSFIKDWVSIGKTARLSTKAAAGNLSFEMQCRHCEKVVMIPF